MWRRNAVSGTSWPSTRASRRRADQAQEQLERRGLAGAVRPDEAEDLALAHAERDLVQHPLAAQAEAGAHVLGDGVDADDLAAAHARPPRRRRAPVRPSRASRHGAAAPRPRVDVDPVAAPVERGDDLAAWRRASSAPATGDAPAARREHAQRSAPELGGRADVAAVPPREFGARAIEQARAALGLDLRRASRDNPPRVLVLGLRDQLLEEEHRGIQAVARRAQPGHERSRDSAAHPEAQRALERVGGARVVLEIEEVVVSEIEAVAPIERVIGDALLEQAIGVAHLARSSR